MVNPYYSLWKWIDLSNPRISGITNLTISHRQRRHQGTAQKRVSSLCPGPWRRPWEEISGASMATLALRGNHQFWYRASRALGPGYIIPSQSNQYIWRQEINFLTHLHILIHFAHAQANPRCFNADLNKLLYKSRTWKVRHFFWIVSLI